eukprot:6190582-Pyramimonas_sp.AAC.1
MAACTMFKRTASASGGVLEMWWMADDLPEEHMLAGTFTCEALATAVKDHPDVLAHATLTPASGHSDWLDEPAWTCSRIAAPGELAGRWAGSAAWMQNGMPKSCSVSMQAGSAGAAGSAALALEAETNTCGDLTAAALLKEASFLQVVPSEVPCLAGVSAGKVRVAGGGSEVCALFQRTPTELRLTLRKAPPPRGNVTALDWFSERSIDLPRVPCPANLDAEAVVLTLTEAAGATSVVGPAGWECASMTAAAGAEADPEAARAAALEAAHPGATAGPHKGLPAELVGLWEGTETWMDEDFEMQLLFNASQSTSEATKLDANG